jgi:hypothetical protein
MKTPRKREVAKEVLSSTSRVLFHPRLATVDDAMPSPKKSRKSKGVSLTSVFDGKQGHAEKIEVYEDSKERIPTADYDEDNPFLVQPGEARSKQTAKSSKGRAQTQRDTQMEDDMRNERGVTYVL